MNMALDISRALDPALIGADVGMTLDAWQVDLLRSTAQRVLMLCSRQVGKTTTTALIALQCALCTPDALIVIVSPSERQSAEMLRVIKLLHGRLDDASELATDSVLKIEFPNGARILALPGVERTIRGLAGVTLVIIDEASRVEDQLIPAIRPMLAVSNGRLIALSTPAGKRGWFYSSWIGDASWHRVRVTASDCPRITKEFLAEELRELGAQRYSEEYLLEFLDADEAVFGSEMIAAAFTPEVTPLWA